MRGRFVLRYTGEGDKPEADVRRIAEVAGAAVVDRSARMLLVEGEEEPLRQVVDSLGGWVMGPEQTLTVPDTRKRVQRPPS